MLKKVAITGQAVVIIGLIIYCVFLRECKRCPTPTGVNYSQHFIDSLKKIASQKPDTVVIKPNPAIIWRIKEVPTPVKVSQNKVFFEDSLVTGEFKIFLNDSIFNNVITHRGWGYQLFVPQTVEITKTVSVPAPYEVIKYKEGRELFANFGIGGNASLFSISGGLDYINRKRNLYGFQYSRVAGYNIYTFKLGLKIK